GTSILEQPSFPPLTCEGLHPGNGHGQATCAEGNGGLIELSFLAVLPTFSLPALRHPARAPASSFSRAPAFPPRRWRTLDLRQDCGIRGGRRRGRRVASPACRRPTGYSESARSAPSSQGSRH